MSKIVYIIAVVIFGVIINKYQLIDKIGYKNAIFLCIALFIADYLLGIFLKKKNDIGSKDDDDVFFDQAPNPLPPPALPPTEDQLEFAEFMKKMEREKERMPVERE